MPDPTPPPSPLTLDDLARLLSNEFSHDSGTLERFATFARTDPRLQPLYHQLEAIARDFGDTRPMAFFGALWFDEMVDLLLETRTWKHPDEVLRSHEPMYDEYLDVLIRMVDARATRAEDPTDLLATRKKLEQAHRAFKKRK